MYDIDVQGSHEQECGDDMCHGWRTRGSWMMRKRKRKRKKKKKPIGKGKLVGLIHGPRKTAVSKPRERQ